MVEFPRCAVCRVTVKVGENVVFRQDARVTHSECPPVSCPICQKAISPLQPIRRDESERPVHGNCWMNVVRSQEKRGSGVGRSM